MFILQQLIRTRGIGFDGWAVPFIQFPSVDSKENLPYWNDALLDHYIAMLTVLLHPKCFDKSTYGKLSLAGTFAPAIDYKDWTMLDDEDDHDDQEKSLSEEDIVSLFEQFPHQYAFQSLFNHQDIYPCCDSTLVFARMKRILSCLSSAIDTYSGYNNFVKILGRSITCLVSLGPEYVMNKSTAENAAFLDDAVLGCLCNFLQMNNRGIQLYLSNLPFGEIFGFIFVSLYGFGNSGFNNDIL
jgi:hypothetical protein